MFHRKPKKKRFKPPKKPFRERTISYVLEAVVCCALIVAFARGAYVYAKHDPLFHLKTIRVAGSDRLQDDTIIRYSGITCEDNVLFLNPEEARTRIARMPYVKACEVSRFFPDTVAIAVEERVALATLMVGNRLFEVDDECNVLRELLPDGLHVGPFITNVGDLGYVEPGQRLVEPRLARALAVWRAFSATTMARDVTVSEISAAQEGRISMYCDELRCEIRWGRSNFEKQAAKLDLFWQSQDRDIHCRDYVDLRFGNDVACK